MKPIITVVLVVWFAVVFVLGTQDAFDRPPASPPTPILVGAVVPVIVFLGGYMASARFRDIVLTADLRLLTAVQAWRAGGLAFLALIHPGSSISSVRQCSSSSTCPRTFPCVKYLWRVVAS